MRGVSWQFKAKGKVSPGKNMPGVKRRQLMLDPWGALGKNRQEKRDPERRLAGRQRSKMSVLETRDTESKKGTSGPECLELQQSDLRGPQSIQ